MRLNLVFSCFVSCDFRTESVAEKMLTNWFAFLLHKFLKVSPPSSTCDIMHLCGSTNIDQPCASY